MTRLLSEFRSSTSCLHSGSWCAELPDRCDRHHGCQAARCQSVCTVCWHAALTLQLHRTPVSNCGEFGWGKVLHIKSRWRYELPHLAKFSVSLSLRINLSREWRLTGLAPPVTCYPNCRCLLPNYRKKSHGDTVFLNMSRLNGTAASEAPRVFPQMIYEWLRGIVGMILTGDNRSTRIKTCLSATLSPTNPTSTTLWTNAVFCDLTPARNRLW